MPKYRIERTEMVTRIWVVDAETEEDALDSYPNEEPDFEEEFIIGWHIESDDYVPEDERLQLEYDGGHITYPSPRLDPVTFERTNPRYVPSPAMEAFLMQQG